MDKIKKKIKRIIGIVNRVGLKNEDFTIISNNCWGGFVYQKFSLQYNTPFIGLFIFAPDYIELLENFDELMKKDLVFIKAEDSKYKDELIKFDTFNKYPIAKLGENVEIHFLHYHSVEEARRKWVKRSARIDKKNMLVKFSAKDNCTDELIRRFDKLEFENKICFATKSFPQLKSVIAFKEFDGKEEVVNEWKYYSKYIDIKATLNSLNK